MELRESIKDDVQQELKYILHSQKTRKEILIVGNLKSIQCSITYPFFQQGKLVNYNIFFNIVLCLLSNGTMLPPLVLTTVDNSTTDNEIPVLKVRRTNFTQLSFRNWLRSVWRKRNRYNVPSLLVTNSRLPFRAAELLKKYNTQLVILPDIITADTEPLDEVWCNEFMSEISNCFKVWNQECTANMLPLEIFCKIISSAWMKCNIAANFDKLFLLDEDREIANILEDQFIRQKQWMREPNVTAQEAKFKYEIFEVLRCSFCDNLFHIEECGGHALAEVAALGRQIFPKFRRLVGIGCETYFTCFKEHGDGRLSCEICAEVFSQEFLAAHHSLKHLQQKWCRVCFRQIFVCQKHICPQSDSELSVFAQEKGISAFEDQHLESNQRMLHEGSSTDSAMLLLTQDKDAYVGNVSNDLEDLPLVENQSSENTEDFSLSVHNEVYNCDVQSFPIQKCHKLVGAEKRRRSEYQDENTYTLALKYMSSPHMPVNSATNAETLQNDIDSNPLICDIQAESSSENLVSGLKKASCDSMYFQLLEIISENEDYFLNENVSNECNINPHFFHTPVVSIEETPVPR